MLPSTTDTQYLSKWSDSQLPESIRLTRSRRATEWPWARSSDMHPSREPSHRTAQSISMDDGEEAGQFPDTNDENRPLLPGTSRPRASSSSTTGSNSNSDASNELFDPLDKIDTGTNAWWESLPWYKRPSAWWAIIMNFFIGFTVFACDGAKVQLFTQLVCLVEQPGYSSGLSTNGTVLSSVVSSFAGLPALAEPSELCLTDTSVQASVASLIAALNTTLGVLSILLTVAWSKLSDSWGRIPVFASCIFGKVLSNITFISVSYFLHQLPGSYRFLALGYVLEGVAGGPATSVAVNHSYIADCSKPEDRSRLLSMNIGIFFIGAALGPIVGGKLISSTGNLLSTFYMTAVFNLLISLGFWLVVPESVSKDAMEDARSKSDYSSDRKLQYIIETVLSSLSTLWIFYPKAVDGPVRGDGESGGTKTKRKKDWNMFIMASGMFLVAVSIVAFQFAFEYAGAQFKWRSKEIGYFLTSTGVTKTIQMMFLLPLLIKIFKPKSLDQQTISARTTTLLRFDLTIAGISLLITLIGFVGLAIAKNPMLFLVAGVLQCLGNGYAPALQSANLELYRRTGGTETGKLFGAVGVLQTIGSQVIGPSLFGTTYRITVSTAPQTIFIVSGAAIVLAMIAILSIRTRPMMREPEES